MNGLGRYRREVQQVNGEMRSVIVSRLPARVHIVHDELGSLILASREEVMKFAEVFERADPDQEFERIITEGRYLDPDTGEPKDERVSGHMRGLLLGTNTYLTPRPSTVESLEPEWLIEFALERDILVQLSGNPQAGKSEVVCMEVIRTLLIPGYRFLGRYLRGAIGPEDLARGIVYIMTERNSRRIKKLLEPLNDVYVNLGDRVVSARSLVKIYNLKELGEGPLGFNLFDSVTFEKWVRELTDCVECEGDDYQGPLLIICDNGTAVLRALGMNVQEHIGEFGEKFRALGEAVGTSSQIFVTHSDKSGSNALGGTITAAGPDGEWLYYTAKFNPTPSTPRYLAMSMNAGDAPGLDPTRVDLIDGRPFLRGSPAVDVSNDSAGADDATAAEEEVLTMFKAAGAGGLTGKESTAGAGAIGKRLREARDRLLARGLLTMESEGRQGQRWRLAVSGTHDTHDTHDSVDTVTIDLSGYEE